MNVNIFLKQFKLPNADIVALVKEGKAEEINAERLKGLLKIMPERDEVSVRQFFPFRYNILIRHDFPVYTMAYLHNRTWTANQWLHCSV